MEPLKGACFCGAISYALADEPVLRAFCHCTNCQRLTGCPFVHTIHFDAASFSWTHLAEPVGVSDPRAMDMLDSYVIPSRAHKTRFRCKTCGACVANRNGRTGRVSVWGAHLTRDEQGKILQWERVRPTAHIFYGTRMLDVTDGLGKWEGYEGRSERILES
ncbi:uncharacterized protein LAESUDRAFT_744846 [Laetiporus sulphureus 93-53]|uniref:CENP-V/GFA domain-containing protein n=1 Tax=Laetiporus sulphureus 93-53 TaxID=1314785 RepID=A0A165CIF6_9APHY|nr:uncharacterized protein LAESUDRAFT_744846 [Laetiporus sulphureus 93-53]KZT02871.1 hypothetical protein LAESUDRAFT_744846 [Laetiporus sulphureus 93-53]